MSKAFLILGSSAAGCAGVAGLVYLKSSGTQRPKISLREKFENEIVGKVLLDFVGTTHDAVWEELVAEYKRDSGKPSLGELSRTSLNKEQLKLHCKKEASETEIDRFNSYLELCSRNTLRTQFNDKVTGKKWIDSTQESDWESKKTGYAVDSKTNEQVPKSGASGTIAKNDIQTKNIMDWCGSQVNIPYVKDSDDTYTRALALCTQ
ncbi:hypothetical protein MHC_03745 [Mycoplasma haemocanis str. Illinois]|uniref:Lipoprotein n=1 Tax=Mycoplasma haemocanis (strain Illinois) TaxID=1111676 RepID=H6N7I7_MYCHN|nr:hypothetical protein [Mycoplasma haemocanis]AEW45609.1 hypothetical protein MHC_03745 [Mycoplasma haemocanis str. Illinois]